MSSRYDAPGERLDPPTSTDVATDEPSEELADLELWKALDEGRDPTSRSDH